jgi:signal transduction histidine kinase
LRRLRLIPEKPRWRCGWTQSAADFERPHEVVHVQNRPRNQRRFTQLRNELDEVLDEGMQPMTQRDLLEAQRDARANLARSRAVGLALITASAFVAVAVAVMIARRSAKLGSTSAEELQAALHDLQASERRRGALLRRLVSTQEEERGRIARELHDQLGQDIFVLSLGLATLRRAGRGDV